MREPIVLVPELACDARIFTPQLFDLTKDFSVQVVTLKDGDTIREMAGNLLAVAPERFALAGVGMGGVIATEMLRRAPERVTRLALISSTPLAETPEQAAARETQIVKAQAGQIAEARALGCGGDSIGPGPDRAKVLALLDKMANATGSKDFVRQLRAMQRRPDGQKVLRSSRVPTLVLAGAHDKVAPVKRQSFMAELIPYAELAVIEEAGHFPTLEAPAKVNAALRAWMELPLVLR